MEAKPDNSGYNGIILPSASVMSLSPNVYIGRLCTSALDGRNVNSAPNDRSRSVVAWGLHPSCSPLVHSRGGRGQKLAAKMYS